MTTSLNAALAAVCARQPSAPAMWYEGREITYAELDERIRRLAAGFHALGIRKGDVVSLWLPNTPAWMVLFFALARIGAMALATNTRFRSKELNDILLRSKAKAIVYWPEYRHVDFSEVLDQVVPHLPDLKHIIEYHEEVAVGRAGHVSYADIAAHSPADIADGGSDTPCLLYTTSGTTSKPKLVVHIQERVVRAAHDTAHSFGYSAPDQRTLQMVPFCGTYGFVQAMAALLSGTPNAVHHTFDAALAGTLIRRHGITLTIMTDEMVKRLYAQEAAAQPFPDIRLFVGSRAHELVELSQASGFRLMSVYGSSEVEALFSRRPDADEPVQRAVGGGLPVSPEARVRARNQETGEILPHGVPGEIEIASPCNFIGYLHDPEATANAFTDDGYFRTGDLGHSDPGGSWTFMSRIGDALRLSGFLVNPLEIEAWVQEFSGVAQCHVVGVEQGGRTVVVAFYISRDGRDLDEVALKAHCVGGMARYKAPARFVRLNEFPMIASMNTPKLDRKALRVMAAELLKA